MGDWKPRSPDSFPPIIATSVIRSKGEHRAVEIEIDHPSRRHAKAFQKQIHFWRFCLREAPNHPLHKLETDFRITSSIREVSPGKWRVFVEVKRNLYDYIRGIA
jgi:hypothetical protein